MHTAALAPKSSDPDHDLFGDWAWVRPRLRVQLYSPARDQVPPDAIVDRLGRDLHRALVIDLPDRIVPIPAAATARWPGSRAEWISTAVSSLISAEEDVVPEHLGAWSVTFGNEYTAARILHVLPAMRAPLGVVFGVPARRTCLVHEVETRAAFRDTLPRMGEVVRALSDGAYDAISPRLYWYRTGTLRRLTVGADSDGAPIVEPPPELASLLARLPK